MSDYDNTNSGALFLNERKKNDKHPDLTGSINIKGTDMWISGWTKVAKSGKRAGQKYISLSVSPMEGQQASVGDPIPTFDDLTKDINEQLP